jgi:FkbH-like protein
MACRLRGVYILDYDGLMARHGRETWRDERKWLTVRLPIAAPHLLDLAREWLRFAYPLAGRIAKTLVVDLDNTLWGGIIAEDGLAGIRLGPEYPGAAFQALQRAMLDIWHRGILLAVCSKNNPNEALEALDTHPGMLLKRSHFSSLRINWEDKAVNLREIAAELNVGIDALAFLDDNPVEREHVRDAAPEVHVLDLPSDPMRFASAVRDCPLFERLSISDEDRQRGQYYATARDRAALKESAQSKEDFYRWLEQEVEIQDVSPLTLARTAELTQKTNQFNLTTRRYNDQEIAGMIANGAQRVRTLRVRDRYGDNGLVGVAITREVGDACEIDTFLLSCRVIGRTVETALLAAIVEDARRCGRSRVQGWLLPTAKNAPARDFYACHGFRVVAQAQEGALWELDLRTGDVKFPEWIRMLTPVQRDDP